MTYKGCPENSTGVPVFLLLGFHSLPDLKPLLFVFFLTIYLLTLSGNISVLVTVASDVRLHLPMYFLLGNLSILEICYMNTIIPTLLGSHLGQSPSIPHSGCLMQFSVFTWFTCTECFLLTVMAYDRYAAICHPLRYAVLMDPQRCLLLAVFTWVVGFLISMTVSIFFCMLQFPDVVEVDHFFCDFSPIITGACSDTSRIKMECFLYSFIVISFPFMVIIVSYAYIISTILKIPSTKGKSKAFSTCSSHLTIVITYFAILTLVYTVPAASETRNSSKAFSLLYTVGTPIFNPIVYTLRNKEMKEALKRYLNQKVFPLVINLRTSEKMVPKTLKHA